MNCPRKTCRFCHFNEISGVCLYVTIKIDILYDRVRQSFTNKQQRPKVICFVCLFCMFILFVRGLFNYTVSSSDYIAWSGGISVF
jgi:dipeptide/tripeptide permease